MEIDRKKILLDEPIKNLGMHTVTIKLGRKSRPSQSLGRSGVNSRLKISSNGIELPITENYFLSPLLGLYHADAGQAGGFSKGVNMEGRNSLPIKSLPKHRGGTIPFWVASY